MATKGLKSFLYAAKSTGAATYTAAPAKLAGACNVKLDIEYNDAKLWADDALKETDDSFASGKITIEIDEDDPTIFAPLLGKTLTQSEVVSKDTDDPIHVGFGYIVALSGGKYRAKFLPDVKFKDFETEAKTREGKTDFIKPTMEGTIFTLSDGTWKKEETFTDLDDAVDYLEGCFTQVENTP